VVLAGQLVTALATPGDHITPPGTTAATSQFSNCEVAGFPVGSLTDPSGDATASSVTPSPDLVSTTVLNTGSGLIFRVRFAPGTFNPGITRASFVLDTDQNTTTGHPGVDSSCTNDSAIMGMDYLIDAPTGEVNHFTGCAAFTTSAGVATVTTVTNGYDVTVPLSLIGGDNGVLNFKVLTQSQISPGVFTGIVDYMSNLGVAPGTTTAPGGGQ
jgi:hypothetical protein